MTVETHIISDSTLRHAEQAGLKADVTCMSGATKGQLATAVEEMNTKEKRKTMVIAAGANEGQQH